MFRRSLLLAFIFIFFSSPVLVLANQSIIDGYSFMPYFQNNPIVDVTDDYLIDYFVTNFIFPYVGFGPVVNPVINPVINPLIDVRTHLFDWISAGYDHFAFYFLQNAPKDHRQIILFVAKSPNIPTGFNYIPTFMLNIIDKEHNVSNFSASSGRYIMYLSSFASGLGNVFWGPPISAFLSPTDSHNLFQPSILCAIDSIHRFRLESITPTPPNPPDPPSPPSGGNQYNNIDIFVDEQHITRVEHMHIDHMENQHVNNIENQTNETVHNQTNYISDALTQYITNDNRDFITQEYHDFITNEFYDFLTNEYITNEYHDFITQEFHDFITNEFITNEYNNIFNFPDDFDGQGFFPIQEALLTAILLSLNSFANDSAVSSIAIRNAISNASVDIVFAVNDVESAVYAVQSSIDNIDATIFSQFLLLFDSLDYWFDGFGFLLLVILFILSFFIVFYFLLQSWRYIYGIYYHLIG